MFYAIRYMYSDAPVNMYWEFDKGTREEEARKMFLGKCKEIEAEAKAAGKKVTMFALKRHHGDSRSLSENLDFHFPDPK